MRIHKLLATVLVAGLFFSGCLQDEDYVLPNLEVGEESLDFSDDTELKINLTASRDWLVRSKPDWVAVDPDHGTASAKAQRVVVSVLPNSDYNRTGEVLFTIGLVKVAIAVKQPGAKGEKPRGSGTLEDPYTVGGAVEFVSGLAADTPTTDNVYIKGRISQVTEEYSAQYGNGTFYIADDEGTSFYVFRAMYLGNKKWTASDTQIQVGDEVVICGQVVNFKGNTPETVANKGFIYSLNGKVVEPSGGGGGTGTPSGTGTLTDPYNIAGAVNAVKDLTWTSNTEYQKTGDVYVKGKISRIAVSNDVSQEYSAQYGNASFYISDDGTQNGEFYVFRALYLGNKKWVEGDTQIKVGDEVIICGQLMNYRGNTPETVGNACYLYSLNGTTGDNGGGSGTTPTPTPPSGTPSGTGALATPYNVAAAIDAVKNLTWTSNDDYQKTEKVYVKGKICEIASNGKYGESGTYGNASFYISDDGKSDGAKFYVYRALYLKNEKYTTGTDIKVGDEVIIHGELMNYRGNTPETVANSCYLYSLNGETGEATGGSGTTPPSTPPSGTPSGTGALATPFNVAAAIDAVKNLTWTSNDDYQKTEKVYVKGKICEIASKGTYGESGTYGNASFYISDDGKSDGAKFYVYRALYLKNEKYTTGTDIKVGDEVIIYGELMNYKGNTPETVANACYLYSLNGKTE